MRKLNNELREAVTLPPEITAAEILITEQWPWGGWPVGHCSSNHNKATESTSQSHAIKPQYVPNKYLLFYHVVFRLTFKPFSETVTIFICGDIGTTYITSTVRNNSYTGFTPSPQFPEWNPATALRFTNYPIYITPADGPDSAIYIIFRSACGTHCRCESRCQLIWCSINSRWSSGGRHYMGEWPVNGHAEYADR